MARWYPDPMERRTKIICTVGPRHGGLRAPCPASTNARPWDVVRVNMSHSDHETALRVSNWIKTLNRKVRFPVPVLLDTQGPEIRTGDTDAPVALEQGAEISLRVVGPVADGEIHINYPDLPAAVEAGSALTLDNGLINLEVIDKSAACVRCRVVDGGLLGSRKHVNMPGVHVNLPSIGTKDRADILFGMAQDVDFVALSFVRTASDVMELRHLLGPKNASLKVIAKIENREGLENAEEIARGGGRHHGCAGRSRHRDRHRRAAERAAGKLVRTCARLGKRCIVATHLLESMIETRSPTRAEVTDVANAVYEGVDAVMLSGETSVGRYPVRSVEQLLEDSRRPASAFPAMRLRPGPRGPTRTSTIFAWRRPGLAEAISASGIVVFTRRGLMADPRHECQPPHRLPILRVLRTTARRGRRLMLTGASTPNRTAFSTQPEKDHPDRPSGRCGDREGIRAGSAAVVVLSDVLGRSPRGRASRSARSAAC